MFLFAPVQPALVPKPLSEEGHAAAEFISHQHVVPEVLLHDSQPFLDTLDADLPKQKRCITRLKNDVKKAKTLEAKIDKLKQVGSAENALRRMRMSIFDAQDAIVECLKSGSTVAFECHASLFPKASALLNATFNKPSQQ